MSEPHARCCSPGPERWFTAVEVDFNTPLYRLLAEGDPADEWHIGQAVIAYCEDGSDARGQAMACLARVARIIPQDDKHACVLLVLDARHDVADDQLGKLRERQPA